MNSYWFYGSAKVRSIKVRPGEPMRVTFGSAKAPLGSNVAPPDEMGSTSIEHRPALGCKIAMVHATGEDDDGITAWDITQWLMKNPDERFQSIAEGWLETEQAVRKQSDSDGGEQVEHRFTVALPIELTEALNRQAIGKFYANPRMALLVWLAEVELPAMPPKRRPGRPAKDEQPVIAAHAIAMFADSTATVAQTEPVEPPPVDGGPDSPPVDTTIGTTVTDFTKEPDGTYKSGVPVIFGPKSDKKKKGESDTDWMVRVIRDSNSVRIPLATLAIGMATTIAGAKAIVEASDGALKVNPNGTVYVVADVVPATTDQSVTTETPAA